jgi:ABC-type multidrug transport system permease subunit
LSDVGLALRQTRYSLKGYLRESRAVVFTIVMPIFLLFIFNAIFHGNTRFMDVLVPVSSYYTAAIIAFEIMMASVGWLLVAVTTDRERGFLKRTRGTPVPNWIYLAGEIGKTILVVSATIVVLVLIGVAFYHVKFSLDTLVGLVVYTVVGAACMCAIALAGTRLCPTTDSATSLGPFATVVLAFISGVFIPASLLPPWLIDISKVFPLEHLARGLQSAFVIPGSTGLSVQNIGVLAGWGIAGIIAALFTFRWEPFGAGA